MTRFTGQNTKSLNAKFRKKVLQQEKELIMQKEKEDKAWIDDDKHVTAKISRKSESIQKHEEKINKKQELRKLKFEEEKELSKTKSLSSSKNNSNDNPKLTRAEISRLSLLNCKNSIKKKNDDFSTEDDVIPENINHIIRDEEIRAHEENLELKHASGIDTVLKIFDSIEQKTDRHPEKRMKAAWNTYQEKMLPLLREQYKSLKRSQLLDMLQKEWKTSPENPLNHKDN